MKHISLFFLTVILAFSCVTSENKSTTFESGKLVGQYEVDITPVISELTKTNESDDEWDKVGKGLAGMALASMDIEIVFYENNKGIMYFSGGLVDFAAAFSDEPIEKTQEFVYKVENDSILYMKEEDSSEYRKWATVQKFDENYDFVKLLIHNPEEENVVFNLKKKKD